MIKCQLEKKIRSLGSGLVGAGTGTRSPCPRVFCIWAEERSPFPMLISLELHSFPAWFLPTDGYATVDRRERRTLGSDSTGEASEKELLKVSEN